MPTFDPNAAHTAVSMMQSRTLHGTGTQTHNPQAGSASNFGVQRSFAWGVGRGAGSAPEALNALNSGSFRKFDSGPGFQPVEMR